MRLSEASMLMASKLGEEYYQEGNTGKKNFEEQICAPLKYLEHFQKEARKEYGKIVDEYAPFHRIVDQLTKLDGLKRIRVCTDQRPKLYGSSDVDPGIAECRIAWLEMAKRKHPKEEKKKQEEIQIAASPGAPCIMQSEVMEDTPLPGGPAFGPFRGRLLPAEISSHGVCFSRRS
jgi:hypothetical protein